MIERRQRNDFVRRREFDMLRKLRQREAAGGVDSVAPVSSFNSSNSGKSDGRALTLKKIDEIEQQMSQQWWKGRPAAADAASGAATPDAVPGAADAYSAASAAGSAAGSAPTPVGPPAAGSRARARLCRNRAGLGHDGGGCGRHLPVWPADFRLRDWWQTPASRKQRCALRNATTRAAKPFFCRRLRPAARRADHDDSWRALFDMYRATGDVEKFEHARTRYTQRFGRLGPEWISLRAMAREMQGVAGKASAQAAASAPAGNGSDWTCPPRLKRDGIAELMRALGAAGPGLGTRLARADRHRPRSRDAAFDTARALGQHPRAAQVSRCPALAAGARQRDAEWRPVGRHALVGAAPACSAGDAPAGRFRAGRAQLLPDLRGVAAALGRC